MDDCFKRGYRHGTKPSEFYSLHHADIVFSETKTRVS